MNKFLLLLFMAFTTATLALAQEEAVAVSGKRVMLHQNGTLTLIKDDTTSTTKPIHLLPAPASPKPSTATQATPASTHTQRADFATGSSSSSTYKRSTSVQCSGTTQKGAKCKRMTLAANGRCYQH